MPLSPETERVYAEQAERSKIHPQTYRNQCNEIVVAVQLTDENFSTVMSWAGGEMWCNGNTGAFVVGLVFGEYEDKIYVPFGWWITQRNGKTDYLSEVAFKDEYERC
jgi:hypothetical protein